jgi:uncharacterized protein with von Willebrand factor type A (vWA) domain
MASALRVARLGRALRERGVDVSLGDEIDAARALGMVDGGDDEEVRQGLRIALKIRRDDWELFDRVLHDLDGALPPAAAPAAPRARGAESRGGTFPRWNPGTGCVELRSEDSGVEGDVPGYSPIALLRRSSLPDCSADLRALERALLRLARRLATLQSRRLVPTTGRGFVDPGRSLRRAVRTRGELISLARRRRALEVPRLVFLCDTSGSMSSHARFLLAFALALKRVAPRTEVFAFNTTLTRLTRWIAPARLALTLERLAEGVPDWGGGTRIGDSLAAFVRDHLRATVDGRTTVLILSDGLDRGEIDTLRAAMRAIRARARRVLWLNPLLRDPRYRPEARGMEAALPFVDHFAAAHDAASLERLIPHLVA